MQLRRGVLITLLAASLLLIPSLIGSFLSGVPTAFSPFPALTVIPALMFSPHFTYLAALLPSFLFLLWNPQLFREEGKIPIRTYLLFVLLIGLSTMYFVLSWKWGLRYPGPQFTAIVCSINVVWVGFLGLAFRRCSEKIPSFRTSVILHWMLFAWLSWYAFPWLGD
jgi:hypothetical protein